MIEKYQITIDLIKELESFKPEAYLDSEGRWTIGYGTIKYPNNTLVEEEDICRQADANFYLSYYLNKNIFPDIDKLQNEFNFTDGIYVALCSLGYNIGVDNFGNKLKFAIAFWHTENGLINLANAFRLYTKIKDKNDNLIVCQGLVNRREREIKEFLK